MSDVNAKATAGEWEAIDTAYNAVPKKGRCVAVVAGGEPICLLVKCKGKKAADMPDARLIAAAPALLAVVRMLVAARTGDVADVLAAMDAADAVLAKAT